MKLTYKAATKGGKILYGILEAKDPKEAAYFLRKKNLVPITIKVEKTQNLENLFPFLKRHRFSDLILFTRQLSSMLTSGLTLIQALRILNNQIQNTDMKDITTKIIADLEEGKTFSQSLGKFPEVFSPIYISLIKAGESSGFLDTILQRLAVNLEKQQELRSTVRSALLYPAIIIILMVVVMSLMMILVIPKLTSMYHDMSITLPVSTQIIITISDLMTRFGAVFLIIFVMGLYLYRRWSKTPFGKQNVDKITLHLPIFGKLFRESIIVEFSRTLGLLMSSGALVTTSLQETAAITGNVIYTKAILEIASDVEKGITIGNAMESYSLFPPMLIEMIKVGEETGKLDESLLKVSDYFEREVTVTVKNLTIIIEPLIMVVLGLAVAFLVFSIITPIYNLTTSIK